MGVTNSAQAATAGGLTEVEAAGGSRGESKGRRCGIEEEDSAGKEEGAGGKDGSGG